MYVVEGTVLLSFSIIKMYLNNEIQIKHLMNRGALDISLIWTLEETVGQCSLSYPETFWSVSAPFWTPQVSESWEALCAGPLHLLEPVIPASVSAQTLHRD